LEHADHAAARDTLTRMIAAGDQIAIAPQVLAEFIHIVTDPRRFTQPLDMTAAIQLAEQWWTARETVRSFPDHATTWQFLSWLRQFSLGRKRLLDTLLAATYADESRGLRGIWPVQLHHTVGHADSMRRRA
jgi:predicted nucleic acid-binding protein